MISVVDKNFISTISHIRFDPTKPCRQDIVIEDIAHALSLISRANGHFTQFFSVARHSINCALEAKERGHSARVQLLCLLHDAAEAYIGDMTRPLKMKIPYFSEIEREYQKIIFAKFIADDITDAEKQLTRNVDDTMLYHEFLTFNGEKLLAEEPEIHIDIKKDIKSPEETKAQFLSLFNELRNEIKEES